jgi:uncharacterized repeat protein (TIGR03803 family)
MTSEGGSREFGVIFSFDPSSSTYKKLKDFDGTNGGRPHGSLMQARDGKLYGMTTYGGSGYIDGDTYSGNGVIFSFDPSTSTYKKLKDFDGTNGGRPHGSLMQASDEKLYGMTSGGGSSGYDLYPYTGFGVIFSFEPSLIALIFSFCFTHSYSQAGELDPSFGNNGIVISTFGSGTGYISTALQSDGKIVVGGSVLARYNTDGSLDTTFATDGYRIPKFLFSE